MIKIRDGVIVASCVGAVSRGGSGTILANNNSVLILHNLGVLPTRALATPSNDTARQTGVMITAVSGTALTVAYPVGVTQPADGTFYYEVGV